MYAAAAGWLLSILAGVVLGVDLLKPIPAVVVQTSFAVILIGAVVVTIGSLVGARRLGKPFGSALLASLREGAEWVRFFIP